MFRNVRLKPEIKFSSNNQTNVPVDEEGTGPLDLTDIVAQGVGPSSYIGTMISPKLLQYNGTFRTRTDSANIRWYVVQWLTDDSIDSFSVTKYLRDEDVNGFPDFVTRAKYRTLRKGAFALQKFDTNQDTVKILTLNIRPRLNVFFTGAGGIAQKNHIYFFAISDVVITNDAPLLNSFSRMLYNDS